MQKLISLSLSAFLATAGLSAAFAAGSSSGGAGTGGGGSSAPAPKAALHCKKGEVIKKVAKNGVKVDTCVKLKAGILLDEELYQQGRQLAKDGQYDWALEVLAAIQNQNDPRVLNYTGYSNRKAGRIDVGITYYRKALAINPNFVLAREYLGEGYVAAGRIDLAQVELTEIKNRAGVNSEEYKNLLKAISTATN
jgi:tetratricopeptide (TPR) repeat protein